MTFISCRNQNSKVILLFKIISWQYLITAILIFLKFTLNISHPQIFLLSLTLQVLWKFLDQPLIINFFSLVASQTCYYALLCSSNLVSSALSIGIIANKAGDQISVILTFLILELCSAEKFCSIIKLYLFDGINAPVLIRSLKLSDARHLARLGLNPPSLHPSANAE